MHSTAILAKTCQQRMRLDSRHRASCRNRVPDPAKLSLCALLRAWKGPLSCTRDSTDKHKVVRPAQHASGAGHHTASSRHHCSRQARRGGPARPKGGADLRATLRALLAGCDDADRARRRGRPLGGPGAVAALGPARLALHALACAPWRAAQPQPAEAHARAAGACYLHSPGLCVACAWQRCARRQAPWPCCGQALGPQPRMKTRGPRAAAGRAPGSCAQWPSSSAAASGSGGSARAGSGRSGERAAPSSSSLSADAPDLALRPERSVASGSAPADTHAAEQLRLRAAPARVSARTLCGLLVQGRHVQASAPLALALLGSCTSVLPESVPLPTRWCTKHRTWHALEKRFLWGAGAPLDRRTARAGRLLRVKRGREQRAAGRGAAAAADALLVAGLALGRRGRRGRHVRRERAARVRCGACAPRPSSHPGESEALARHGRHIQTIRHELARGHAALALRYLRQAGRRPGMQQCWQRIWGALDAAAAGPK